MAALAIFLLLIKRIYCHRVYEECHLHIKQYYDKPLLKEMGGFAGWSLLVSSTSMIANYGSSIIINIFFGTILNAAQAIVGQISAQLSVLGTTITKAVNPLIDKTLGSGNRKQMLKVSLFSTKISFFLLAIVYLPFLVQISFLLKLWLKVVPAYAVIFCFFQLVRNLVEQLYLTLISAISAEGNIKSYSIYSSMLNLAPLPISFIIFKLNYPPYYMYLTYTIFAFLYGMLVLLFVNKISQLSIKHYFREVFSRCTLTFLFAFAISYFSTKLFPSPLLSLLASTTISIASSILIIWILGFNKEENAIIKRVALSIFKIGRNPVSQI
jgi:Na+-driven multidrug efflux pump